MFMDRFPVVGIWLLVGAGNQQRITRDDLGAVEVILLLDGLYRGGVAKVR
jgi:hypothetical protein